MESTTEAIRYLSNLIIFTFIIIWGVFLLSYAYSRTVSNNMLGAFERILSDIKEMNKTGVKRHLTCRKKDTLTGDLVEHFNTFMDKFTN